MKELLIAKFVKPLTELGLKIVGKDLCIKHEVFRASFYDDDDVFVPAFACLGFLSPANRGALMTCAMVLFVCLGTPAGYVSARIYKSFGGEKWKSNVLLTSMLSPGYVYRKQEF